MRRWIVPIVVLLLVLAALWWWTTAAAPEVGVKPAPAAESRRERGRGAAETSRGDSVPMGGIGAAAGVSTPAPTVAALQARDERRRGAVARFSQVVLERLNSCLPQTPGARAPHRLALRFARTEAGANGEERFAVTTVDPIGALPTRPPPQSSPTWPCFAALVGSTLAVDPGDATQPETFVEVVTVPLPEAAGWSQAPPPGPAPPL